MIFSKNNINEIKLIDFGMSKHIEISKLEKVENK